MTHPDDRVSRCTNVCRLDTNGIQYNGTCDRVDFRGVDPSVLPPVLSAHSYRGL